MTIRIEIPTALEKRETSTSRTATRSRATDMFAHASPAPSRASRVAHPTRAPTVVVTASPLAPPPRATATRWTRLRPTTDQARQTDAETAKAATTQGEDGRVAGWTRRSAAPPSAAEVAASERFDAIVAKGGAVFEVFAAGAKPVVSRVPSRWSDREMSRRRFGRPRSVEEGGV